MLITVFGANGYQAKLVLGELSRHDVDLRLVGRNAERVDAAAAAVGIVGADRRVATAEDHTALVAALAGSDVVINCAGPFTGSGEAVVRAAIDVGAHYLDTSGEQLYLKSIFDTFAGAAEHAGVTVLPSANDGCVPTDLLAQLLAEQAGPFAEITISHVITGRGGPSRGSLRSVLATIDAMSMGGLAYDNGHWRTGLPARRSTVTLPDGRSVDVAGLPLCEVITIPRHVQVGYVEGVVEASLKAALGRPIPTELIQNLPEGPTELDRNRQRFTYVLDAVDPEGKPTRGVIQGTDTYGTTAVVAVEAARRLAAGESKPGVLAPAQAFDATGFLEALSHHGLSWTIDTDMA